MIDYSWRGDFGSAEVEALHAECFSRQPDEWDWAGQVERHSLGWVCARDAGALVGWVNLAWDGAGHAFILDTIVTATHRRRGVAAAMVAAATARARDAGCECLHVDFEDHLTAFYFDACGFTFHQRGADSTLSIGRVMHLARCVHAHRQIRAVPVRRSLDRTMSKPS